MSFKILSSRHVFSDSALGGEWRERSYGRNPRPRRTALSDRRVAPEKPWGQHVPIRLDSPRASPMRWCTIWSCPGGLEFWIVRLIIENAHRAASLLEHSISKTGRPSAPKDW